MRTFVIQEHNAVKAGLHWDIRFEDGVGDNRILRSFVIPKHKMPGGVEKLLAINVEDHPWNYRNFEGTLHEGYGKGDVKLIFCGEVPVEKFTSTSIHFEYMNVKYILFYVRSMGKWLIKIKGS